VTRALLTVAVAVVCACDFHTFGVTSDGTISDGPPDVFVFHDGHDGPPAQPMVTFVQGAGHTDTPFAGNGNGTVAATFGAPAAGGNLIAVWVTYDGSTGILTNGITDNVGNVYATVQTIADATDVQKTTMAYAKNIASGATTVTVALDTSVTTCCRMIVIHELHGADRTSPVDGFSSRQQSGATTPDAVNANTIATSIAGDYIFAVSSNSNGVAGETIAAGTSFMSRVSLGGGGGNATLSEDVVAGAPGATMGTFTYGMSGVSMSQQVAYKP
jgi:hypothetical protein